MTELLVFGNPGELDPRAITTMGVNVKPDASPIGYFGTGAKFAIATTLRLGGRVAIQSGFRRFSFERKAETIRGKVFELVRMASFQASEAGEWEFVTDEALGFTTDLGRNWLPWMAYREFWANARDEKGEDTAVVAEPPAPRAGWTSVIVECEWLLQAHRKRHEWLLEGRKPLWAGGGLEVYPNDGPGGFYHGIKVVEFRQPMAFTYNLLGTHTLTEDRTIPEWNFKWSVTEQLMQKCDDEDVLRDVMLPEKGSVEAEWGWQEYTTPSPVFLEMAARLVKTASGQLAPKLWEALRGKVGAEGPEPVAATPAESRAIAKAKGFLAKLGYRVDEEIVVVESLGSQWLLGAARGGKIYLPRSLFGKGTKVVVSTILEEHLHCHLGLVDESRELQDWLFDQVVTLGEEVTGEVL